MRKSKLRPVIRIQQRSRRSVSFTARRGRASHVAPILECQSGENLDFPQTVVEIGSKTGISVIWGIKTRIYGQKRQKCPKIVTFHAWAKKISLFPGGGRRSYLVSCCCVRLLTGFSWMSLPTNSNICQSQADERLCEMEADLLG